MSEIERLRELVDAGKEDRKAIDELVDENLRLRECLLMEVCADDDCWVMCRVSSDKRMFVVATNSKAIEW